MNKAIEFIKSRNVGFYVTVGGAALAIVAYILFFATMSVQNNMVESVAAITAVALALAIATCAWKDYMHLFTTVTAALYLLAGLLFLVSQAENIGYAITDTGIGDGIMATFVASTILYGLATVASVVAAFLPHEKSRVE